MSDSIDLVIPNIADFNLRHPTLRLDPATVNSFTNFGYRMGDQSVFWSLAPRVLILYPGYDELWFADVHRFLDEEIPPVVSPVWRSGQIVPDLLTDKIAMRNLRNHLKGYNQVRFVTWGATEELYKLAAVVGSFVRHVMLDVPQEEHYWSSLYLDSKISCLDLASQIPQLRVSPCVTAHTWEEARGAIDRMMGDGRTAIVRSAYGVSGEGTVVISPKEADSGRFWRRIQRDPLLNAFPLLIQRYIPRQDDVGCPAVDMLISDSNSPDEIADYMPSAMTVDGHHFVSVNIGDSSCPDTVMGQMMEVSLSVAAAAKELGFSGWFGIDFILDHYGGLYVTEFNARRTSGTEWFPLLDGREPRRHGIAHSRNTVPLPRLSTVTYRDLREVFQDAWHKGIIVFPTTVRSLSRTNPSYGIVAWGSNSSEAENDAAVLHGKIMEVLKQCGEEAGVRNSASGKLV